MKSSLFLALAGLLSANAQMPRPQPFESPVVHADRTVTLRFAAPNAKRVELSSQFTVGNQEMRKDEAGVWSITVGPVKPDLYPYNFVVDGIGVSDPANPDLFPNERFKASLVDIPGDPPLIHAVRDVPHGEVSYHQVKSAVLGATRPLLVYTPPGYRAGTDRLPVFYLVSGTTDTEETWFKVGKLNSILDNLIAEKRAVPMIVAMPYGNMMRGTPAPNSPQAADMYRLFSDELTKTIMPFVEATYRTREDREARAIAGFSRGGGQSLFTGFLNQDKFAWIGSYSAYLTPAVMEQRFAGICGDPEGTNGKLKLLWLGVGKQDFLYNDARAFDEFLTAKGIRHTSLTTDGGHTWMNARAYLTETLQRFFR
ncbi:MAG: esterase [Verrucomicrobia bacterium]|nr:esterase [Verrucomicrobiota bacterium]